MKLYQKALLGVGLSALLLGAGWPLVGSLAASALKNAPKRATDCLNEVFHKAEGNPEQCATQLEDDLSLALWWPGTQREAAQELQNIRYSALSHALDLATAVTPNATQRDLIAKKLLAVYLATPTPNDLIFSPLGELNQNGAFQAILESPPEKDLGNKDLAFSSLWASSDLSALKEKKHLLAPIKEEEAHLDFYLHRGSWLCLLGKEKEGLEDLVRAGALYDKQIKNTTEGWPEAQLGMILCHGEVKPQWLYNKGYSYRFLNASLLLLGAAGRGDYAPPDRKYAWDQLPEVARRLPAQDTLRGAWAVLASRLGEHPNFEKHAENAGDFYNTFSFKSHLDWNGRYPVEPEALEASASALQKIAAKPLSKKERLEFQEQLDEDYLREKQWGEALYQDPGIYLNSLAWMFFSIAANRRIQLGQLEKAKEDLQKADALAVGTLAEFAPLTASGHILTNNPQLAIERLTTALASNPEARLSRGLFYSRAQAYAKLGKFEEAYQDAKSAWLAAQTIKYQTTPQIAWLFAALSYKTGRKELPEGLPAIPSKEPDAFNDPLLYLSYWWGILQQPEAKRKVSRYRADEITTYQISDALPAVMYLVGEAARDAGEQEVWLDRIFHQEHNSESIRAAAARAEAARWRGDLKAAAYWDKKLNDLQALTLDTRSLLLLALTAN